MECISFDLWEASICSFANKLGLHVCAYNTNTVLFVYTLIYTFVCMSVYVCVWVSVYNTYNEICVRFIKLSCVAKFVAETRIIDLV